MAKTVHKNLHGGVGEVIIDDIDSAKNISEKCTLFAVVTIPANSSLGYHEHHGECETYYILSGVGEYDDNGVKRTVKEGDITYTPSGKGHGLKNIGTESVKFLAVIIKD